MEQVMREALKEARTAAEADRTSLEQLGTYFLDALVQSGVSILQLAASQSLLPGSIGQGRPRLVRSICER